MCEGPECGDDTDRYNGVCDKDGCEFGAFRQNQHEFYGNSTIYEVDSSQPFTIVTQFITDDGTDTGDLIEIRRIYVQNGNIIPNPYSNFETTSSYDSLSDGYCSAYKDLFGEVNYIAETGNMKSMGDALERGMVLIMCLWEDAGGQMLWLDSQLPVDGDPEQPGVLRGPCPTDSGKPDEMHELYPDAYVKFYNLKVGELGTTFPSGAT